MIARITAFKFNKARREDAIRKMEELKPQIMALPGLSHFVSAIDDEGNGHVIAFVSDKVQSDESKEQVSKLWAQFADYLENKPEPKAFEVVADWQVASAPA